MTMAFDYSWLTKEQLAEIAEAEELSPDFDCGEFGNYEYNGNYEDYGNYGDFDYSWLTEE